MDDRAGHPPAPAMAPEPATGPAPERATARATEPGRAPARKGRSRGCLLEVVETVVLTVLIFLGIQTFVAQPYRIEGGSMEMTLLPEQYVLIDKLTPRWAPYERGDIVVLDPPRQAGGGGAPFIKRVIGVAGDRVELKSGIVYVNGAALDEGYIFAVDGVRQTTKPTLGEPSEWLVPAGEVFVMGDHRAASSDSRTFGPVETAHVLGRAWLRYWPIDMFGVIPGPD